MIGLTDPMVEIPQSGFGVERRTVAEDDALAHVEHIFETVVAHRPCFGESLYDLATRP